MKKIFAVLLILVVSLAVYAPALRDGFVWDDTALVLRDPLIRSWRLIPEAFNHFLFIDATASDFYRPIQRLTYTGDYAAFAFQPAGYHATSMLCHAAAAVALFLFAEELLLAFAVEPRRRRVLALLASLVWAIHPIQNAAVIYISGRADPLAAFFGFLGGFFLLLAVRTKGTRALSLFIATACAFLLSALSKEIGLIFLALALVLVGLINWRALWKPAGIALLVCVSYFSLRLSAEHHPAPPPRKPLSWSARPIVAARAFAEYAGLILLPVNLHMDRQLDVPQAGSNNDRENAMAWRELQSTLGFVLIGAVIYWAIRARKQNRAVFVSLILAAISYLPVSGIVMLNATVAEHWLYLPSAFLFLAATIAIVDLTQKRRAILAVATVLFSIWFVFLAVRTFIRAFDWKDQRTFLERTIASHGDSARMLINLGGLELSEGHLDLASTHLHEALKREPDQPLGVLNLATVALKQNDFKMARELLLKATGMPLVEAQAHELLAALENKEHGRANLLRMRLAARTGAPNWSIEKRYVKLLDEVGAPDKAIAELQHVLATQRYRADSWKLLSELLAKVGSEKESSEALARAHAYDVHLLP